MNKKISRKVLIIILMCIGVGSAGFGFGEKYKDIINNQKAIAVANQKTQAENDEKKYYEDELNNIRVKFANSTMGLYKVTKDKTGFDFDKSSKQTMAEKIIELDELVKEKDRIKMPTVASIDNFQKYTDIKDICDGIDKFNIKFVHAIDNKNGQELNEAAEELKAISKIMDKNKISKE